MPATPYCTVVAVVMMRFGSVAPRSFSGCQSTSRSSLIRDHLASRRRRRGGRSLARPEAGALLLHPVDRDRDDQDGASDDLLPEALDTGDREAVLERADEEHSDCGARHAADAAEEARAAEQYRSCCVERDVRADHRACGTETADLDTARDTRAEPGD